MEVRKLESLKKVYGWLVVALVALGLMLPTVSAELLSNETQDDIIQLAVLAMVLSILFGLGAYFRFRR